MDREKARVIARLGRTYFLACRNALTPVRETRHGDACTLRIGPAGKTACQTIGDMAPPIYGFLVSCHGATPLCRNGEEDASRFAGLDRWDGQTLTPSRLLSWLLGFHSFTSGQDCILLTGCPGDRGKINQHGWARAVGGTTCSSSGCGALSNTRRCISRPTNPCPRLVPLLLNTSTSIIMRGLIKPWIDGHRGKPTPQRPGISPLDQPGR